MVESKARKENTETAPQRSASFWRKTEEFLGRVKIPALNGRDLAKVNVPFTTIVPRRPQVKFIRLSVLTSSLLHSRATLAKYSQRRGQPSPSFRCLFSFDLLDFASMAHEHYCLEIKSSFQAISGLWVHGFGIIGRVKLRHSLLLYAWAEELQRKLRHRKRNFQEYVALLQYLAGWRVEGIGFHEPSLHQVRQYSTLPLSMTAEGDYLFPQMNEALGLPVVRQKERNETSIPVPLFSGTGSRYVFFARFFARPAYACAPWWCIPFWFRWRIRDGGGISVRAIHLRGDCMRGGHKS